MKNLKKLTILHSNDLHGDFLAEKVDEKLVGGVSRLSGYINKVRNEEKNVIYTVAGDMFRSSLIDSEFQGISTIEIMNLLVPDVVTLGNHEVDYGLAHLLFLEKCATFPIINANMYLKLNGVRLFNSHYHYLNLDAFFDIKKEDIERNGTPIKVASSTSNVLEEYFVSHPLVELSDAPRIIVQE